MNLSWKRSKNIHFAEIGGKNPSGLGNQIFNFSKTLIANQALPGKIIAPKYGKGIHEIPLFLKEFSTIFFKWQRLKSKIGGNLLIIDQDLYQMTAEKISDWDYRVVFTHLVSENPGKRDFYHCSGMSGGYLGIFSLRDELKLLFNKNLREKPDKNVVAIHIRGPVQHRSKAFPFYKQNDFEPEKDDFKYGDFNSETPTDFYIRVIDEFGRIGSLKEYKFLIVTNLSQQSNKVSMITQALTSNGFEFTLHNGDTVDALKTLMTSRIIVPSVSSFSLLSLFLSDAKYIWPRQALFDSERFLSIWGYELGQFPTGPTARAIEESVQHEYRSGFQYRGLPFPLKSAMNIEKWLLFRKIDTPKCFDLIYYGVVPSEI